MPLSTAFPDSGSNASCVGEHVRVDARVVGRDTERRAVDVVSPAVRQAHHARHDRVGHLHRRMRPRRSGDAHADLTRRRRSPRRAASSGCTWSVQRGLALHEDVEVVHPRVVRAKVAAPDQHDAVTVRVVERGAQTRRRRPMIGSGASSTLPARRAQHARQARLQRAEIDAVRLRLEPSEREAVGIGAEAVAVGTGAQHEVEEALGALALRRAPSRAGSRRALRRWSPDAARPCRPVRRRRSRRAPDGRRRRPAGRRSFARRSMISQSCDLARRRGRRAVASSSRRCAPRAGRARGRSGRARAAIGDGRITSAWRVVSLR